MYLFTLAWAVLAAVVILHLLLNKREPSGTIAWMLFVIMVPILGALIYLVLGPQRLERHAIRRKRDIDKKLLNAASGRYFDGGELRPRHDLEVGESQILQLAHQVSEYRYTEGNCVELLPDPAHALSSMKEAISRAEKFVHLEYYIIAADEVTREILSNLLQAAKRGVEVRILYDAVGSMGLKRKFFRKLLDHGAKVASFLPFSLLPRRMNVNFRNHRKILIVDGHTAFTGGTNLGREYLGRRQAHQWQDYSVKVQGPVCRQLQDVFAQDWHFTTQEDLFSDRYYPAIPPRGDTLVQVMESGPHTAFRNLHQTIFLAITSAKHEILLTTPYFIPDPAIHTALVVAALRGVKVELLLPLKSDAPVVRHASRSFFDGLLRAGASIYEYRPRVLHAKLLVIDRKWTMLGSANMDIRSFRLNFELNLLAYGPELAEQTAALFEKDRSESTRVDLETFSRRPVSSRLKENACRLLSPIL